jgi:predicted nucleotidyltransferase
MMATQHRSLSKQQSKSRSTCRYVGKDVSKSAIHRFARDVAERFKPEKIILFGSHAYGRPHKDSDVDILVIMRAPLSIARLPGLRLEDWLAP